MVGEGSNSVAVGMADVAVAILSAGVTVLVKVRAADASSEPES